jgi:signal transduction histidine kinase
MMRYTPPSRPLRTNDRRLLEDLAGQLGTAVHAGGLITALQQARERLVLTREEERRRLRRDLHDGLGPALAGLTLKAETTRNLMISDPAAVDAALLGLRRGIQATVADVRRLVEGLRPPALDDLGLLGALSEAAQRLGADGEVEITVQVPADLPPLSAAAEVAAYRICLEALTNTVRHADATRCTISVGAQSGGLRVAVADDGCGIRTPQGGNGLHTMRERAEELGGRLTVSSHRDRGTMVEAFLPVTATSANQRNIRAEVAAQ